MTDLQERAAEAAGNWRRFDHFAWYAEPDNAENWHLYHYVNRDSGLLEESNAAAIEREMARYISAGVNVQKQHFTHWAVGWVDALAVRVYDKRGRVTAAFRKLCEIQDRLADYPVLDDDDYSNREYEATVANIADAAHWYCDTDITEDQSEEVFSWLFQNNQAAIEADSQAAYPDKEAMTEALAALGLLTEVLEDV